MGDEQINVMATSLKSKLGSLPAILSSKPCIYKAPKHIFKVNEDYYRPSIVSIGPLYYQDPSLETTVDLKLRHLQCFLNHADNPYTLEDYLEFVREQEEEVRACYAEKITLSSNEFIEMLLIDASFIIFLWYSYQFSLKNHPSRDKMIEVFSSVERDLFLEENQIPFFILDNLYDMAYDTSPYSHVSFVDLTCTFIYNRFVRGKYTTNATIISEQKRDGRCNTNIKHLVDFLRTYIILPSNPRPELSEIDTKQAREDCPHFPLSITELKAAGVKFATTKGKNLLLDIRFVDGVLHIPSFTIQDTTEPLFRSLLLFEQCHYYFDSYFIDYMYILFHLIKSPRDVRILVENGIIDGWLASDEEVANVFKGIITSVPINLQNYYYSDIARDLNAYASTRWHRWKVILQKDYFNHPWAITSVIYAIALLILTLLQTISGLRSMK